MGRATCGVLLAAALVWASCITAKRHPYELDDAHVGAPGVETIGLLPCNAVISLPPELEPATDEVTPLVREHVSAAGIAIVSFGLKEALSAWTEATAGEPGYVGEPAAEQMARYVKHLHAARPFDVLVIPSLVYRDARIRHPSRDVAWDGVVRKLGVAGYIHEHGSVKVMPEILGKMPAVSLHLAVYDAQGTRIFDSFGGLDLVHEVDMGTPRRQDLENRPTRPSWSFRFKTRPLSDETLVREGVALTFSPWLEPRARAAAPIEDAAP